MKKLFYAAVVAFFAIACSKGTPLDKLADAVVKKAETYVDYGHYTGAVFTQAL